MPSSFLLQIVNRATGEVIQFEPGKSVEAELNEEILKRVLKKRTGAETPDYSSFIDSASKAIVARGVGVFATEAHVTRDIKDGMRETLLQGSLPDNPAMQLANDIEEAISGAFKALKKKVRPT